MSENAYEPTFTEIEPKCPTCSKELGFLHGEIVASGKSGAHIPAYCPDEECGWKGEAQYRMTNLISS